MIPIAFVLVATTLGAHRAADATKPQLRIAHIEDGIRQQGGTQAGRGLRKLKLWELAERAGLDLANPKHPLVAQAYRDGLLIYMFFKTVERALGDRPYLIQRIKKTERFWKKGEKKSTERVTYQVEVFKTQAGALKRYDMHYGGFFLRDFEKREVIKEYEIGFGEVKGQCEGTVWPRDPGKLFFYIQRYASSRAVYDLVKFTRSTKWRLEVQLARDGEYRVRSPQLHIDAPKRLPTRRHATPKIDRRSRSVELIEGQGVAKLEVGASDAGDIERAFGPFLESVRFRSGTRNVSPRIGLTFNLRTDGTLNSVITRPGFGGRTSRGVRHGDSRQRVRALCGEPKNRGRASWRYDGVVFHFDGFDQVERIVIGQRL